MSFEFTLADIVSILVIIIGMVGTYWKLSNRMSILDVQVERLESDIIQNKKDTIVEVTKLEHKLDIIGTKIEKLLIEVGKLQSK